MEFLTKFEMSQNEHKKSPFQKRKFKTEDAADDDFFADLEEIVKDGEHAKKAIDEGYQ